MLFYQQKMSFPIECKYSNFLITKDAINKEIFQLDNLLFKINCFGFVSKIGFNNEF